jgi:8-oxo-dGTP pyrophosphatase MutT (NUDIX family)
VSGPIDGLRLALIPPSAAAAAPSGKRRAGVMLLLDPGQSGIPLLFVRRADFLRRHPGQIGFPGGSSEPIDADIVATALREAGEEVGLDGGNVEVIGTLPGLLTQTSDLWVTPVVGVQRHPFTVRGDGHEVAETFWLTLEGLLHCPHRVRHVDAGADAERNVHFYDIQERTIWGVTGGIVHDLLALVGRTD